FQAELSSASKLHESNRNTRGATPGIFKGNVNLTCFSAFNGQIPADDLHPSFSRPGRSIRNQITVETLRRKIECDN
ncbi:hypothetical protein MXB_2875, partial [Myxobolus squamalis]